MCRSRMSVLSVFYAIIIFFLSSIVSSHLHPAHAQIELQARLIRSFPSPGPGPQDLAWDGNHIWVADDSTDSLYKLDPTDGSVISILPAPGPKPRGLTWDGTCLWCSDSDSAKAFRLNPSNGSILAFVPVPVSDAENASRDEVRGLTWDGGFLWSAYFTGWSSRVNQVDPIDGTIVKTFYGDAEGLAFDGRYLWNVDSQHGTYLGFVKQINVLTGHVILYFRTSGYYPTGLTFDGQYFWLADNGTDTIEKLSLKGDVNNDAALNVLDAIRCVNIILEVGDTSTDLEIWEADYNWDGQINVLDVVGIINEILV